MVNPILDQDRLNFINARKSKKTGEVSAWPREEKTLPKVQLEVDFVFLSTRNHRTTAEQLREIAQRGDPTLFTADPNGPMAQGLQNQILQSQEGFADLKDNLKKHGQKEPAIITADGILINGNRRAAALRSLYLEDDWANAKYVTCLVLPDNATPAELVDLETELQVAREFREEYTWINEAMLIEELYDRENKDFNRVANRMHREPAEVQTQYDKLQLVHELIDISNGSRLHIEFKDNESAFEELSKYIKNRSSSPASVEAVKNVYFLGILAKVHYRDLRHLRRPDADVFVLNELNSDPTLSKLSKVLEEASTPQAQDPFQGMVQRTTRNPTLQKLVAKFAETADDEEIEISGLGSIDKKTLLTAINTQISVAADEAKEDSRDTTNLNTPIIRARNAAEQLDRALKALPTARAYAEFEEDQMAAAIEEITRLIVKYSRPN